MVVTTKFSNPSILATDRLFVGEGVWLGIQDRLYVLSVDQYVSILQGPNYYWVIRNNCSIYLPDCSTLYSDNFVKFITLRPQRGLPEYLLIGKGSEHKDNALAQR